MVCIPRSVVETVIPTADHAQQGHNVFGEWAPAWRDRPRYSRTGAELVEVKPAVRMLAIGGIVGPLAFVGAWAALGTTKTGYSSINDAISDLAAHGASTHVGMTIGFVVFSLGLVAFGLALHGTLAGPSWIAAIATGGFTLGVAAAPLGGWTGDGVHATFAGLGYTSIVSLQLLAVAPLARSGRRGWAGASVVSGTISAAGLIASTFGPQHGLWQRLGLTTGDVWIVVTAWALAAARGPAFDRARPG